MLMQDAPAPEEPERRLVLPTVEDVMAADPDQAGVFGKRRAALFSDFLGLRDRISHLTDEEYSRMRLLESLFGEGTVEVGTCWQGVYAVRGSGALRTFNEAVKRIIASGCVLVQ